MNLLLLVLALGCLVLHPISPSRATFLESTNKPKISESSHSPVLELNPDETTQSLLIWRNFSLTQQEKLPNDSTRICRCLACTHMTAQKTLVRFSSIGTINPQTGRCHLPVPVRPGGPTEETTREKYQVLSNPGRVTLSWVKQVKAKPENGTLLVSKLHGRKGYIARRNLANGLMAFGSVDPKLPETWLLTSNVSTRNASFPKTVEVLVVRLTREQTFFLESPFGKRQLELNPDEIEYRVQLSDGPDSELDLSCKVNFSQWEESEPENGTIFLELYRKASFPLEWENGPIVLHNQEMMRPVAFRVDSDSSGQFLICRSTTRKGEIVYGMVEPISNPSDLICLQCTVYHGGQLWRVLGFEVLTNPGKVEVKWVDVPNWREIPSSAFTTSLSLSPTEACNRNMGRDLNKRYIGRLVTAGGTTQAILSFPDGFKDESVPNVASPFGRHVKLNESSARQVLVDASTHAPSSEQSIMGLACKKTSQLLDLSTFREETNLTVKMRLEMGGELVEPRIQTIFRKVEPRQLVWQTERDIPYKIPTDASASDCICRYRCRGSNACPSRQVTTLNGSTLTRTIDRTIGHCYGGKLKAVLKSEQSPLGRFSSLVELGVPDNFFSPEVERQFSFQLTPRTCRVAFDGAAYKTEIFDKLTNASCLVRQKWVPVSGPLPNGTLAVVNEVAQGEKVFIGRIQQRNGRFLIGQVAKSGLITFVDEVGKAREERVDEKVSLLTVEAGGCNSSVGARMRKHILD